MPTTRTQIKTPKKSAFVPYYPYNVSSDNDLRDREERKNCRKGERTNESPLLEAIAAINHLLYKKGRV